MNISQYIRSNADRQIGILENEMLYDDASVVKHAANLVYNVFNKNSDFRNVKKGIGKVSFTIDAKENITVTLSVNTESPYVIETASQETENSQR